MLRIVKVPSVFRTCKQARGSEPCDCTRHRGVIMVEPGEPYVVLEQGPRNFYVIVRGKIVRLCTYNNNV